MNLNHLLEFEHHANSNIIAALEYLNLPKDERPMSLMSHVINALELYLKVIRGESYAGFDGWADLDLSDMQQRLNGYIEEYKTLIQTEDTARLIIRNTSKGDIADKVEDLILHVLFHSEHHRSQIAMLISERIKLPPSSNFIIFAREHPSN